MNLSMDIPPFGSVVVLPSLTFVWLSNIGSWMLMLMAATMPLRMSVYS